MNHKKGYRDRHPFIFKTKSPHVRKTFLYNAGRISHYGFYSSSNVMPK